MIMFTLKHLLFTLRCLTRPRGRMLLGVPMAHDEVQFNSQKIYGPLGMSHVLANWEQIHSKIILAEDRSRVMRPIQFETSSSPIWMYQPGIVVQKMGNHMR